MTILVDTNVWIDLIQADPDWLEWSRGQLIRARASDDIVINAVIYAELVPTYDRQADLDEFVRLSKASMKPLNAKAAWDAGIAFAAYRAKGGTKTSVIADFFIGAQAQCENWALLTRDAGRYRTYFPRLQLICP